MRPTSQQLQQVGRAIVDALVRSELVASPASPEAAAAAVAERFEAYFKAASALEGEAEQLAEDHLRRASGGGSAGLDRRRVVQMIKERLARERGFPV